MHHKDVGLKHLAIMVACCAIPIAVLLGAFVFKIELGSLVLFGVMLACPLLHILMMRGMMGHQHTLSEPQVENKEKTTV